ncbi:MAG: thioredoxin family protein [Pirellulales bacterium]|nr:thioredoxin family protein [Pirellulales bacterium]
MQARTSLLCTAVVGCLLTSAAFGQQAIQWQPTLDVAKRVAGQTNRLVLVHFWSPSCGPCRAMERDVFPRPDVAAALESRYVAVKLNADHFPATARQFGVTKLPTDVVISPQGQVIETNVGAAAPENYIAMLSRIAAVARPNAPNSAQSLAAVSGHAPPVAPGYQSPLPGGYPNHPTTPPLGAGAVQPSAVSPPYGVQAAIPGTPQFGQNAVPPAGPSPSALSTQPNPGQIGNFFYPQQPNPGAMPAPAAGTSPQVGPAPQYVYGQPAPVSQPPMQGPAVQQSLPAMQQNPASHPQYAGLPGNLGQPAMPAGAGAVPSAQQPGTAGQRAVAAGMPPAAAVAAETQTQPQVAAGNPPLALDGYCPVQLAEKERWVKGNPRWGLIHQGRTYLFAGPDEQARFYTDPDRYAPVYSGADVVLAVEQGQEVSGRREHGAWFDGRVYLFSSEESYSRFNTDPYRYLRAMQQLATSGSRTSASATGGRY